MAMHNRINTTEVSGVPQKKTQCGNNFDSFLIKHREVRGYVNGAIEFGNMCFVIKMSEPVQVILEIMFLWTKNQECNDFFI